VLRFVHFLFRIGGVIASEVASSAVDIGGLESTSVPTKDYKTGICGFSANHAALKRKGKDNLPVPYNKFTNLEYKTLKNDVSFAVQHIIIFVFRKYISVFFLLLNNTVS
jgi:hypothetical protein